MLHSWKKTNTTKKASKYVQRSWDDVTLTLFAGLRSRRRAFYVSHLIRNLEYLPGKIREALRGCCLTRPVTLIYQLS